MTHWNVQLGADVYPSMRLRPKSIICLDVKNCLLLATSCLYVISFRLLALIEVLQSKWSLNSMRALAFLKLRTYFSLRGFLCLQPLCRLSTYVLLTLHVRWFMPFISSSALLEYLSLISTNVIISSSILLYEKKVCSYKTHRWKNFKKIDPVRLFETNFFLIYSIPCQLTLTVVENALKTSNVASSPIREQNVTCLFVVSATNCGNQSRTTRS